MARSQAAHQPEAHVPGHGGPRSERSRRAILQAARSIFAQRGYEQTTIRTVAAQAGIDPAMVMRYFGSKAGLFAAATTAHLAVPDLGTTPATQRGEFLVRHFVNRWEDNPVDDTLVFLLRTAVTNDAVAAQLQDTFNQLLIAPLHELAADHPSERAALIGTQLLGLALCRYVLHLQPIASMSAEQLIAQIGPVAQLHLTQPFSTTATASSARAS
jgi:AcrR family transcriptional regulator